MGISEMDIVCVCVCVGCLLSKTISCSSAVTPHTGRISSYHYSQLDVFNDVTANKAEQAAAEVKSCWAVQH